jgi:two-component sensor histidine kinase
MALVHEKLYQSANLAQLNLAAYTQSLVQPLLHTYSALATRVRFRQDVPPLPLAIDMAIPCGLILNELVTNALKHAFPGETAGEIVVEVRKDDAGGRFELRVSDDGVGLPNGFEERESSSLGLRLVRMLTAQLQGRLEVRRGPGVEFRVTFPVPDDLSAPNNSNNSQVIP